MSYEAVDIEVGDWVRFYQNGKLVIGQVEYILKTNSTYAADISTDIGSVNHDTILEVRKGGSVKQTKREKFVQTVEEAFKDGVDLYGRDTP